MGSAQRDEAMSDEQRVGASYGTADNGTASAAGPYQTQSELLSTRCV